MNGAIAALALYTGFIAFVGVWLMVNVAKEKRAADITVGDGGNPAVIRAQRGQSNFIETAPITIILLMMLVFLGAPAWLIHILGLMLLVGRALHANHFISKNPQFWQRGAGFMLTMLSMAIGAVGSIIMAIWSMVA